MKGNVCLKQIIRCIKQDFYVKTHLSPKIKSKTLMLQLYLIFHSYCLGVRRTHQLVILLGKRRR